MSGIIDTVGSKSGIVGSDVYPAGHVIQVKHSQSFLAQSFDTDVDTILTVTMTNVLASSMCICLWGLTTYHPLTQAGFEGYVFRDSTNLHLSDTSNTEAVCFHYSSATGRYSQGGGSIQDTSPTTGTNIYTLKGSSYASTTTTIGHDGLSSLTVMEIAQ
jgi:hypothetical protein